jgi:hypothetical protein
LSGKSGKWKKRSRNIGLEIFESVMSENGGGTMFRPYYVDEGSEEDCVEEEVEFEDEDLDDLEDFEADEESFDEGEEVY